MLIALAFILGWTVGAFLGACWVGKRLRTIREQMEFVEQLRLEENKLD